MFSSDQTQAILLEALLYRDVDTFLVYFGSATPSTRKILKQILETPIARQTSSDQEIKDLRRQLGLGLFSVFKPREEQAK